MSQNNNWHNDNRIPVKLWQSIKQEAAFQTEQQLKKPMPVVKMYSDVKKIRNKPKTQKEFVKDDDLTSSSPKVFAVAKN